MSSTTKGFTVNVTNKADMPDIQYINELAKEKNFEFGGEFTKAPPVLEDLFHIFEQEREEAEDFDIKNHVFSPTTVAEVLGRPMNESETAYYGYTTKFLNGLNYPACPGFSPMDKALNVIMYMTYLSEQNNKRSSDPTNPVSGGKPGGLGEQALSDMIKEMSKGAPPGLTGPGDGGDGGSSGGQELTTDIVSCVRDHLYGLSPAIANIYSKTKVADVPINRRIIQDIKIKSYLEDKVGLETSLEKKMLLNNASKIKKSVQMTSHAQMMKTNKTLMILPNFDDKLAKKELSVTEKIKPETRKQMLTMLLDDSGSMGSILKQSYVRGVLMNRLESVTEGKSKLNFYLYESKRYGYKEVTDLKSAQDLYKNISLRSPSGGGTHIGFVLQETIDEIYNVPGYHDPEIMIVCDGDDHVDPKALDLKGVKISCVLLGTDNPGLKELSTQSGGFYTVEKMYNRY